MNFSFWWIVTYYFRSAVKWFLRKTTGLCELQRICYGEIRGPQRTHAIERSLSLSKHKHIQQLILQLNDISGKEEFLGSQKKQVLHDAVRAVLLAKQINPRIHRQFVINMGQCIEHIWGYKQLISEVERLRTTQYDCDNIEHETQLYNLWRMLKPDEELEGRITKQWQNIGFQGEDPKTDFRGMGLLGLENLVFFATFYCSAAQHVLTHSYHPQHGYCFAIVGINLTSLAWTLLKEGCAKSYVYNNIENEISLKMFHHFYCYLFYEFDRFWMECRPKDIMEFSNIKSKFEYNIRNYLKDPNNDFRIGVTVHNI
ncbi:unnamed protein product [Phyllotreta striolata]|uniref:ELMO domain-containing protein n=1 Tax=Phyllotreta striolata TaxID=444603 RepID=A0A9N9TDJ9_PHYSR|nr:unnamed protein product [Phyllotreta striolata]